MSQKYTGILPLDTSVNHFNDPLLEDLKNLSVLASGGRAGIFSLKKGNGNKFSSHKRNKDG